MKNISWKSMVHSALVLIGAFLGGFVATSLMGPENVDGARDWSLPEPQQSTFTVSPEGLMFKSVDGSPVARLSFNQEQSMLELYGNGQPRLRLVGSGEGGEFFLHNNGGDGGYMGVHSGNAFFGLKSAGQDPVFLSAAQGRVELDLLGRIRVAGPGYDLLIPERNGSSSQQSQGRNEPRIVHPKTPAWGGGVPQKSPF